MKNKYPLDTTADLNQQIVGPTAAQEWGEAYSGPAISVESIQQQEVVNGIINARLDTIAVPRTKEEIDFNKLRDLLFSIRDNGVYCPLCRAPEFSPSPTMRSSHYEDCALGLMCEQLLRLYPRDNYVVKWRK